MASFKFFNSWQYKQFENWCELNNKIPSVLLKNYMRFTVILDSDLTDSDQLSLNKQIKKV
ncbi:hypothetical protein ES702_02807 [subsurface metagenome]